MNTAEIVVKRSMLQSLSGNKYAVTLRNGQYLSIQPDGTFEGRDSVGAWETGTLVGDLLVFEETGEVTRAIRVVNL
jgi:hypothetical protein